MSNDVFDIQILNEKLTKLNNSQQSIESLSRWCILHRKKARQIVETWDKLFSSAQKEQRVSFLYLANDILQNSRRTGSEFVNEFWKVLPGGLKQVYENGDELGKKVVTRLVGIWEERKVFGSRGQGLKDEMLGKNPPALSTGNGKSSNNIKIIKKDANSIRFKLAIGSLPEKILSAFQIVTDENFDEDAALNKCTAVLSQVGKIREEMENGLIQGNQQGSTLVDELQMQEDVLQQCIGKLESAEATRVVLISQLKEAIQDQESKLEFVRTRLQAARGQIEQAVNLRNGLVSSTDPGPLNTINMSLTDASKVMEHGATPVQPTTTPTQPQPTQPVVSFAPIQTADEDSKKAAAAAVAAKLAASTSSAQMLTSVLSSLVAEEAASLKSTGFAAGLAMFSPEKRQKLDKPLPASDHVANADMGNSTYFNPLQPQSGTTVPPTSSMQSMSQANQLQTSFSSLPPLPPPPPLSPANPPTNQYVQSTGMMIGVMPYGYGSNSLPPPPPLPPHIAMGLGRPSAQQPQSQPQQPQQQQQTPATGGYYRPPGIGFYGQNHQPATPPVPRQ